MPRPKGNIKSHLPANEVGICRRVREARIALGLSQQEFSGQVGISRERLASYEDARVPLKTLLALQVCNQFVISERWLATGAGYLGKYESEIVPFSQPMARMCMGLINDPEAVNTNENLNFSAAYKDILEVKYLAYWDQVGLFPRIIISQSDNIGRLRNVLQYITSSWIGIGGEAQKKRLLFGLIRAGYLLADEIARGWAGTLLVSFEAEIEETGKKAYAKSPMIVDLFVSEKSKSREQKDDLTNYPTMGKSGGVKPILPKLIERLKKATAERGQKTKLASWLGVTPQKVTDWISGRVEPSGETTLRLLHWVEQQERQK